MKNLFLLRGLPGSGKSTWIKSMKLEPYTVSTDKLREMYAGLEYNLDGNYRISDKADKQVWNELLKILESRMNLGLTTFVDACNIREKYLAKYVPLAYKYGYKIYIVDFTDISVPTCIDRNRDRGYKRVSDTVIFNMYERLKKSHIPNEITVLTRNKTINKIVGEITTVDNKYEYIQFIGDIHGCYKTLQELFKNGIKDNVLYVFTGDYVDRGPDSVKTVLYLSKLAERDNFIFLQGNHERWLRDWVINNIDDISSKEFKEVTIKQFNNYFYKPHSDKNVVFDDKKKEFYILKKFVDNLREYVVLSYNQDLYFACHGGLPNLNVDIGLESGRNLIKGVGHYSDVDITDNCFKERFKNEKHKFYQIHGHRNFYGTPIQVNDKAFNLEGAVERGGCLRSVIFNLKTNEIMTREIKNIE